MGWCVAFAYYNRLSKTRQAIYRKSARVVSIPLADVRPLQTASRSLQAALLDGDTHATRTACRVLAQGVTGRLAIPPVEVQVLAARPHNEDSELHGLYNPAEDDRPARICVWMRTAKRRQVVAFKSLLRTLLHELCHHIDYEYLRLAESFHTEGFYQRESSLFHQLCHEESTG
jgi:hypothetical protein